MSPSTQAVVLESLVMTGFVIGAVIGFRTSGWVVVVALASHGFLDATLLM